MNQNINNNNNLHDSGEHYNNGNCKGTCNGGSDVLQSKQKNRICRDFVKGFCRRMYCRFPHVTSPEQVIFCHDYQNSSCSRINCKFLHYSVEESEYYKMHGEFRTDSEVRTSEVKPMSAPPPPPVLLQQQLPPSMLPPPPPPPPQSHMTCNEFGMYARCRHNDGYIKENVQLHRACCSRDRLPTGMWNTAPQMPPPDYRELQSSNYRMRDYHDREHDDYNPLKRSATAAAGNVDGSNVVDGVSPSSPPTLYPYKRERLVYRERDEIDVIAIIRRFEDEQTMLRRRVEANELKIAELRASNEYLMTQNTHLRLHHGSVQVSTVMSPPTHTASQNAIIGTVSIAPVQMQATPIVSIAPIQCSAQIIATSSATPITIAATSAGQQLAISQGGITTLSSNTQHLSTAAQQILGASQITLTPAALAQGLTINNTSQGASLTMSNGNQPIISYPVMTTHNILQR